MEGLFYERAALAALGRIFGYVPTVGLSLYEHVGSARDIFSLGPKELSSLLGHYSSYSASINMETLEKEIEELEWLSDKGCRFVSLADEDYPDLLRECPDRPLGIYFRSASSPTEVFGLRPSIAIVGTRNLTPCGKLWCERIVRSLSESESSPVIVSGLAFGADSVAHRTALECGLPTVGVMATGIDDVYPWQHRELAERMVETPGCALVTDYPPKTSPVALNFVRRNRIIAGLSSSTIVIESAEKGGSLITARYANDYSRDVYALPGRVDDRKSAGCNSLIRKQMAEIIDSLEDLPERLGLSKTSKKAREDVLQNAEKFYRGSLPSDKVGAILEILEEVKRNPGIDYDGLSSALSLPFGVVAECAGLLENDGFISTDLIKRCTINGKIV